jgi:hypothetical protein
MSNEVSRLLEAANLSNRAMKFRLSRGGTARRFRDEDAEALVKSTFGDEGQIVSKELFKDKNSIVRKYQQKSNEMYAYHINATLPLGNDGGRALMNTQLFSYTGEMGNFISALKNMAYTIVTIWDAIVAKDIADRNNELACQGKPQSASVKDYPTASQMEKRLYVSWYGEPIPSSDDPRWSVPQEMRDALDKQYAEQVEIASREVFGRMLKPVSAFIEKLNTYKGEKGQKWHDSFVDNLNALSRDIPKVDFTGDPAVNGFLAQIDDIVRPYVFNPGALKEDEYARMSVKAKLEALEGNLKGYAF